MFSDRDNKNAEKIETLIGQQCNIVGNLNGGGLLKIDGTVDGNIMWQDDIIIGPHAVYNGNISCKNAFINGKIKGNIICEEILNIESSGVVNGDITVKKLVVKDGGCLEGKCTMIVSKNITEILD